MKHSTSTSKTGWQPFVAANLTVSTRIPAYLAFPRSMWVAPGIRVIRRQHAAAFIHVIQRSGGWHRRVESRRR
jgi:hypothetical protein